MAAARRIWRVNGAQPCEVSTSSQSAATKSPQMDKEQTAEHANQIPLQLRYPASKILTETDLQEHSEPWRIRHHWPSAAAACMAQPHIYRCY